MGYQNNSKLLSGSCRSHAFTCGMNATNNTNYSTLDLQNFLYSSGDEGVLKGKSGFNKLIILMLKLKPILMKQVSQNQ